MAAIETWYERLDREACEQYESGRRERQLRRQRRRWFLLRLLAATAVPWIALAWQGVPYESFADLSSAVMHQLAFALPAGLLLLGVIFFIVERGYR